VPEQNYDKRREIAAVKMRVEKMSGSVWKQSGAGTSMDARCRREIDGGQKANARRFDNGPQTMVGVSDQNQNNVIWIKYPMPLNKPT